MDYVGTCACGGLKSDGEAATEEEYKNQVPEKDIPPNNKRKWKCPYCYRVNEGDLCSCGYVKSRFDKFIDEENILLYFFLPINYFVNSLILYKLHNIKFYGEYSKSKIKG